MAYDATVRDSWSARIGRAEALAAHGGTAASLLHFYAITLRSQARIFDALARRRPSGALDRDVAVVRDAARPLFDEIARRGPEPLVLAARELTAATDDALDETLLSYWRLPCGRSFFPKAILQPYGEWLGQAGVTPTDRDRPRVDHRCPRCGGLPQLSILDEGAAALESGGRQLQCANCLNRWPFRRVLCAHCGEQNEARLGYFRSEECAHLRIDSCDTCRRYLKTIDLGRLGLAVPIVDEVAGVALDVWATEQGYEKIELNLVGL